MGDFPPENVKKTVNEIAQILKRRGETIATSEAACGGLISAYLISVPGASAYYVGGRLSYSLKSRLKLEGWSEQDISSYTGPSQAVAEKLARNMKMELASTYALSETAWAGPINGTEQDKNVGTLFIGLAAPKYETSAMIKTGLEDRCLNMQEMAKLALEYFLDFLRQLEEK